MFIIPCFYEKQKSMLFDTIDSIIKFHPNEKIIVVDSNSPDKSYFSNLPSKVEVLDIKNKRRVIGALMECNIRYPDEDEYILILDSCILLNSIQEYIDRKDLFWAFLNFENPIYHIGTLRNECINWIENLIKNTKYEKNSEIFDDSKYFGVFGSMGIYSNRIVKKFISNGLYEHFNSYTSEEGQYSERAIGYLCMLEGIDLSKFNIDGDVTKVVHRLVGDSQPPLKHFKKIFFLR